MKSTHFNAVSDTVRKKIVYFIKLTKLFCLLHFPSGWSFATNTKQGSAFTPSGLQAGRRIVQVGFRAPRRRWVWGLQPAHEEDRFRVQPFQLQGGEQAGEAQRQEQGKTVAFYQEEQGKDAVLHPWAHTPRADRPVLHTHPH